MGSTQSGACGGLSAPAHLDMAGQRGGLTLSLPWSLLLLLLLSLTCFAVLHLALGKG